MLGEVNGWNWLEGRWRQPLGAEESWRWKIKMARENIQKFLGGSVFSLAGRDASQVQEHRHLEDTIEPNADYEFLTRSTSSGKKASHFSRGWNTV